MAKNMKEEAFQVLYRNLIAVTPQYSDREVILCPICLAEIAKDAVIKLGVEHIIPKVAVKDDPPHLTGSTPKNMITQNQRSGITVLCRRCNGLKGSRYDRAIGYWLSGGNYETTPLTHRQYVAVLIMGYLGAFQTFGYEYILRPELDEIRRQFDFPEATITAWLSHIRILPTFHGVFTTEDGNPFLRLMPTHEDSCLELIFRKFWVVLPGVPKASSAFPKTLETLLDRIPSQSAPDATALTAPGDGSTTA